MNAHYSDSTPVAGGQESQGQGELQRPIRTVAGEHLLPVDPQQPLREYASPKPSNAPAVPPFQSTPWPAYPTSHPSQPTWPGYTGQPVGTWPPAPVYPGVPTPYPGYPPYVAHPSIPGSGMPMYGYNYGYYSWPPVPPTPKRDTYLFAVGIAAFVCSCLAILGGLVCIAFLGLFSLVPSPNLSDSIRFAAQVLFLTLGMAGVVGGGFCTYHSVRSAFLRKPSSAIWLPRFWLFLLCYLATLGLGYWLHTLGADVTMPLLTALLIYLGAVFPALTILTLGIRRLRFPRIGSWPTSWRRLTLALVSGATLAIILASILEFVFEVVLLGAQGNKVLQSLVNSDNATFNSSIAILLLIMLAVVAPLIEELVKPLAVIVLIGRVRSKAEAFALGLACGIGFDLVETTGYISSGYDHWLNIALVRSGAGLLHGLGSAMMALGWYCLTHKEEGTRLRRILLAVSCGAYAIFQHALWNGSWGLILIPGPIGNFVQNWNWSLGPLTIDAPTLFNIIELVGILIFFLYISRRLRTKSDLPPIQSRSDEPEGSPRLAHSASVFPA